MKIVFDTKLCSIAVQVMIQDDHVTRGERGERGRERERETAEAEEMQTVGTTYWRLTQDDYNR